MYDIKWIREHPDAFDRGLKRRGLGAAVGRLIDVRRDAARADHPSARAGAGAAQRGIEGNRPGQSEERTRRPRQILMAEVAELKTSIRDVGGASRRMPSLTLDIELAQIPNMPLDDVPDGRRRERQCRASRARQQARLCFRAQATFRVGRSARPDGFRAGGEVVRRALRRIAERVGAAWNARSGSSCSICIPARMATPKSARR